MPKQQRIALVIGNAAYLSSSPLANAVNDAALITRCFVRLGYYIVGGATTDQHNTGLNGGMDLASTQLHALIAEFTARLGPGDTAVVYYAGHGLQVGGKNYLVPVDDTLDPGLLDLGLIDIKRCLETMAGQVGEDGAIVVFLDASRDDPLTKDQRKLLLNLLDPAEPEQHHNDATAPRSRGQLSTFKMLRRPSSGGIFIGFATAPGDYASDGSRGSRNGPFALALDRHLARRGLDINDLFSRVQIDMKRYTAGTRNYQQPFSESNLQRRVRLNPRFVVPNLDVRNRVTRFGGILVQHMTIGAGVVAQSARIVGVCALLAGPLALAIAAHTWLGRASGPMADAALGSPRALAMPYPGAVQARAHERGITRLALSPSGKWAATGGPDGRVRIWETATGRLFDTLSMPIRAGVTALAVSDGTQTGNALPGVVTVSWREQGSNLEATPGAVRMHLGTAKIEEAFGRPVTLTPVQLPADLQEADQLNRANHLAAAHPRGPTAVAHNWRVLSSGRVGEFELIANSATRPTALVPLPGGDAQFVVGYADGIIGLIGPNTDKADHKANSETPVRMIATDNRGAMVASVTQDGDVTLWQVASDRKPRLEALRSLALPLATRQAVRLRGSGGSLRSVQMSADSRRVLSVSNDGSVSLWDTETGREFTQLRGHTAPVLEARFSSDSKRIVTASQDGTARIWDAETGQQLGEISGHAQPVQAVRFSPNGRFILSLSDRSVRLWDAVRLLPLAVLEATGGRTLSKALDFSHDSSLFATATDDGTARVWRTDGAAQVAQLRGHADKVNSVAFSPDGARLVTTSIDRTARVWEVATGAEVAVLAGHAGSVGSAVFDPDGRLIATASADSTARLWEAGSGKPLATLSGHTGEVGSAVFSPDGKWLLSASADSTALVWDAATGQQVAQVKGLARWLREAAFSADGRRLLLASDDSANIYDIIGGDAGCNPCTTAAFAPAAPRLIVAGADGRAQIWAVQLSESSPASPLSTIEHGAPIARAFLTPDGATAVTIGDDGAARLWRAETGAALGIIRGHGDLIADAALGPDGDTLLVADMSGGLRLSRISQHLTLYPLEPPGWFTRPINAAVVTVDKLIGAATQPSTLSAPGPSPPVQQAVARDAQNTARLRIFVHSSGLTRAQAEEKSANLRSAGVITMVSEHRNPDTPDALHIRETAPVDAVREILATLTYQPGYIFPVDYPTGGDLDGFDVSIGLHSTHRYDPATMERELPYPLQSDDLRRLVEPRLTQSEFVRRLRALAPPRKP